MAPDNNLNTYPEIPENDSDISYNNAKVEESEPVLPPYAHTVNGGMPPYGAPTNPQGFSQMPQSIFPGQNIQSSVQQNTVQQGNNQSIPAAVSPQFTQDIYGYQQAPYTYAQQIPNGVYQQSPYQYQQATGATTNVNQSQQPNTPPLPQGVYHAPIKQPMPYNTEESHSEESEIFDYTFITSPARIAIYDNLKTAPRVIQIEGAPTHEYIERIASLTYKHAKEEGGVIPYTVIREVSENFIHARFQEIVVSIMDKGNTIRFADQGPGIANKNLVQEPGFSSATEPMKRYIRGVGSGLPIVKDYLDTTHGYIEIEDNINKGSVVTISLVASRSIHDEQPDLEIPELTENEERILQALLPDKALGITELNHLTGIAVASVHTALSKMEELGLVEKVNKKRKLTTFGERVAIS